MTRRRDARAPARASPPARRDPGKEAGTVIATFVRVLERLEPSAPPRRGSDLRGGAG